MAKFKARKSRGVRRTYVRRSDFEMRRNAEIGHFTELSMIVQIIHIVGVPVFKPKNEPPVSRNLDRPEFFQLALQPMQIQAWKIHILDGFRSVQVIQYQSQSSGVLCQDPLLAAIKEKILQSFVGEGFYHEKTVTLRVSPVKPAPISAKLLFLERCRFAELAGICQDEAE